jgi:anti-sigma factor (TIGR02949 family)
MNRVNDQQAVPDMGCLEAIEWLYAWLDGEMTDPQSIARLEHHLGHCQSCFSRKEVEQMLTERIRQSGRSARASSALQQRLRKIIDGLSD